MTLRSLRRFLSVARQFLPLLLAYARDRRRFLLVGRSRRTSPETRRLRAEYLLASLLALGPTFIKLGQLLSTRPDVLPPEYIEVLTDLQDQVPPAEWDRARVVIEEELGAVDEHFDEFESEAISGASLGQVYRARIDDDPVAVKVRRPGVADRIETDLRVIRWSLPIILYFVDDARAFSLSNLADEFERTIREEMDYVREASMLREIRGNFEGEAGVVMPAVIDSHSGERVLTMEYIDGTKITDVATLDERGVDRTQVAERLERAYLKMVIEDGVFHADPHPGNLAVRDDGTIVFYDFGMSGRVDEFVQGRIVEFYVAVANRDIDGILDTLIDLGTLSPQANRAVMAEVMELAIEDARGREVDTYRVNRIIERIEDSIYEFPFRLPKDLALVLRMATVVEGVCVTLDEDFDFIAVATTYLTEQGYREESIRRYAAEAGDQLKRSTASLARTPPKLERMLDRFERDDFYVRADIEDSNDVFDRLALRIVYGLLLATTVPSAAFLYAFSTLEAAIVVTAVSAVIVLLLYRSFRETSTLYAEPQFTRQGMRERRRRERGGE